MKKKMGKGNSRPDTGVMEYVTLRPEWIEGTGS